MSRDPVIQAESFLDQKNDENLRWLKVKKLSMSTFDYVFIWDFIKPGSLQEACRNRRMQIMINRPLHELAAFFTLFSLSILFVLNSFPFMYPGYDMWWHMGSIETVHLGASNVAGRFFWHSLWAAVFGWLPDLSIFKQALIVHRVQFLLSGLLVGLSGYWVLRAIFHRTRIHRSELFILAWLGVVIWFIMHGTWSAATGGGPGSFALMSWISWYSLNYQISLPFSLLASAALVFSVSMPLKPVHRALMLMISAAGILVTAAVHAAEVPYFLISAIIIGGLYIRGRKGLKVILILPFLAVLCIYIALNFSDRTPELLRLVAGGEWTNIVGRASQYGHLLVEVGLNRSLTGWNTLTTFSIVLLVFCLGIAWRLRVAVNIKPVLFVLLTGIMPFALLFEWSAGLLATVTYPDVAWRFSLASFLFLGIPISLALIGLLLKERLKTKGQFTASVFIGGIVFFHSNWIDPEHIIIRFSNSIVHSLNPGKMYFDLSTEEYVALNAMYLRLLEIKPLKPICVDVFSANYLFFLKKFHNVYVPGNLDQLPTVEHHNTDCDFPRSGGDLIPLGIPQPPWRFDLVAVTAG